MQARQNMSQLYNSIHYPGYACPSTTLSASGVTSIPASHPLPAHSIKQEHKYPDSMKWPSSHSVSDLLSSGHSPTATALSLSQHRQSSGSPAHMPSPGLTQTSVHHPSADAASFPLHPSVYSPSYAHFMVQQYLQQHQGSFSGSMVSNTSASSPNTSF